MRENIRCARLTDAPALLEIYGPYVKDTPITFELESPSIADMQARMTQIIEQYPWLVFEDEGQILGYVYACEHRSRKAYRWSVDVAVYVRQGHGRLGIGRKLYRQLFQILPRLGYANAFAGITLPNEPSVGLHEAMGFKCIGIYQKVGYKLNSWYDVGWWQLPFQHPAHPPEPRVFNPTVDLWEVQ